MGISLQQVWLAKCEQSANTILYTVSNQKKKGTHLEHALYAIQLLVRALVASALILTAYYETQYLFGGRWTGSKPTVDARLWLWQALPHWIGPGSYAGKRHWIVIGVCVLALWILSQRDGSEESILVMRGLGIQLSSSPSSYLSTSTTRFIPTSQIQDIFIHEAFLGFEVRFYLAVIVVGEKDAVVVFPKLLPKREILETVWRGSRAVLFQPPKE